MMNGSRSMYQTDNDTIAAVSSPGSDRRVIIRLSGDKTLTCLNRICSPPVNPRKRGIYQTDVQIDEGFTVPAFVYFFKQPDSYTGQNLAEIHFYANGEITQRLLENILSEDIRLAQPGEFTSRALLNGKINLAQAEAVNEIITSSNRLQLQAAEKLLEGRLVKNITEVHKNLLDCLSLIEASLDFSDQQIELISTAEAVERIQANRKKLDRILSDNISNEITAELPSVGITGTPNAGKSSLLNALTGSQRSIVHHTRHTTRDVLTCQVELAYNKCIIFDSPGLLIDSSNIFEQLSFNTAMENLKSASVCIFCLEVCKGDYKEDIETFELIKQNAPDKKITAVMTKSDLVENGQLEKRRKLLAGMFSTEFIPVSSKTGYGLDDLKTEIDKHLIEDSGGSGNLSGESASGIALTARHREVVKESIGNIDQAAANLKTGDWEIAAMLVRNAVEQLAIIETQPVDEKVLENIFSRFCIGK
jgi:tRNA modification GTPase